MNKILHASMVGPNNDASIALKQAIENSLPNGIELKWNSAIQAHIDILFINHYFLDTNTIQNYLLEHPTTQYLCIEYNAAYSGKMVSNKLFYPFEKSYDLQHWFSLNFTQIVLPTIVANKSKFLTKNIQEMFIARNGFLRICHNHDDIAIIDTRTERVYINPNTTDINFFTHAWLQTYAKNSLVNMIQDQFKIEDLKIWLWNHLYPYYQYISIDHISAQSCYRLLQWPQIQNNEQQKIMLKISALFSRGAEVNYVANYLNCSLQQIQAFIVLTQLLGMSEEISSQSAHFSAKHQIISSKSTGVFQGFIRKLRNKLGI